MSWFKQTLGKLKRLLDALETEMSDNNFKVFYAEVESRLNLLNEELKELSHLESDVRDIRIQMESISTSFNDILFMKDEIYNKTPNVKKREVERFSKALVKLSSALTVMKKRLKPLEKTVFLIKEEEKKVEE